MLQVLLRKLTSLMFASSIAFLAHEIFVSQPIVFFLDQVTLFPVLHYASATFLRVNEYNYSDLINLIIFATVL
jgi:hypothetical protein